MDRKLTGSIHFASRNQIVNVDASFIQIANFATNIDFQIRGVVQSQTVNTALAIDDIVPKRSSVVTKATDNTDPRNKNTLHEDDPKSCICSLTVKSRLVAALATQSSAGLSSRIPRLWAYYSKRRRDFNPTESFDFGICRK
jgi:hypothetical protein